MNILNWKNQDKSVVLVVVGKGVTFGHNVRIGRNIRIHNNVHIGDNVKLGNGCVILDDLRIPNRVWVKAHTMVTKDNVSELAPGVYKPGSVVVDGKRLYGIDADRAMRRNPNQTT